MAPKKNNSNNNNNNSKKKKDKSEVDDEAGSAAPKLKAANAINVRHILCEKKTRKDEALTKLNEGQSFDTVAREYSEDKARHGGSLGWQTRGALVKEFENVAYALEPSTTNKPKWGEVKTSNGYHIIMVEGRR